MTTAIADDPKAAVEAEGPIVLYDGVCGLCDRSVQLILRNDRRGRFRFAAPHVPHSPTVTMSLPSSYSKQSA